MPGRMERPAVGSRGVVQGTRSRLRLCLGRGPDCLGVGSPDPGRAGPSAYPSILSGNPLYRDVLVRALAGKGRLGGLVDRHWQLQPRLAGFEKTSDQHVELLAFLEDQVAGPRALLWRELLGSQ